MLDLKFIRTNPDLVREGMRKKGVDADLDKLLQLDARRREILSEVEKLKNLRNTVSEEIGRIKSQGGNADAKIAEMKEVSERIKTMDQEVKEAESGINALLLEIPNLPYPGAPVGADESGNVEVRKWGEPTKFGFEPKAHWDLGTDLGVLDFERAAKITGSRFTVFVGDAARLIRGLVSFMIDLHVKEHGYREVLPPFMVHCDSMVGTGQLPKFEEDAFSLRGYDYYLVPTAEVPVTNLHRDEILPEESLPLYYVAYTPCFRAEAGAAGRDTRGLIRQHQFDKVEMVRFVHPETSYDELEDLTGNAEEVLKRLELPYRVLEMCTGDMGFSQTKKYDVEVWMPSYDRYVEISSCSNFGDFQARRANIRFRPKGGGKVEYVHTLNGSGLAVGRTLAAIMENYQQEDGTIVIPKALRPYVGGLERILPQKAI